MFSNKKAKLALVFSTILIILFLNYSFYDNACDIKLTDFTSNNDFSQVVAVNKTNLKPHEFILYKKNGLNNQQTNINDIRNLQKNTIKLFEEHASIEKIVSEILDPIDDKRLIKILESLLQDEDMLAESVKMSYIHVTGFTRLVLAHGTKENDFRIRLHIWWPTKISELSSRILEDKHLHRWDLISKMYSGYFEDQLYTLQPLTNSQKNIYEKFINILQVLDKNDQFKIFRSLDLLELALYPESIFNDKFYLCNLNSKDYFNKNELLQKLNFNDEELGQILMVHGLYDILAKDKDNKYGYKKVDSVMLNPASIKIINDGETYYHHNDIPHRLLIDPRVTTSTLVITAPPVKGKMPDLLMRDYNGEEFTKESVKLSKEELISEINKYIEFLKNKD